MEIHSVFDSQFREYGQVISGYDTAELMRVLMEATPLPENVMYVPQQPQLQELAITEELRDRFFGGMPVQMGWCNGHNTKLNCLEYHRSSEVNLGTEDFILLLGRQGEIGEDGLFDTALTKAFLVPAGVLVALPQGTNTEKPDFVPQNREDTLMTARNKWLLAHPESTEAAGGAVVGLKGLNIDIQGDI